MAPLLRFVAFIDGLPKKAVVVVSSQDDKDLLDESLVVLRPDDKIEVVVDDRAPAGRALVVGVRG